MTATFKSEEQRRLFNAVLSELRGIGYRKELILSEYRFGDWFDASVPEREAQAAAFADYPPTYDNACFGVVTTNGVAGKSLVSKYRALGAPIVLEVGEQSVTPWSIGRSEQTAVKGDGFGLAGISAHFQKNSRKWSPPEMLRLKGLSPVHVSHQVSLFHDLIPALESEIRAKLDPMLKNALHDAVAAYENETGERPDDSKLYKLTFWTLAGKVFRDREIGDFKSIDKDTDPDDVLAMVAAHYGERPQRLLTRSARVAVHDRIWWKFSLRNISVDILAYIWSTTLVPDELRETFGIHRTPRAIASYIVDRLPFEDIPENERIVVEPCSGSAVFLVEAMKRLRIILESSMTPRKRHEYFQRMLRGFEREPFGVEIGKLCLTLADLPSADGWQITQSDVFSSDEYAKSLHDARVVLCNPPFEDLHASLRDQYADLDIIQKPAALLRRTLANLHPEGMLGFVLPKRFVDSTSYRDIRRSMAERFKDIEIVTLPDYAFGDAEPDSVLLTAWGKRGKAFTRVTHQRVGTKDTRAFMACHKTTRSDSDRKSPEEAACSLVVPELSDIWSFLDGCTTLSQIADVHRGIQWSLPLTAKDEETGRKVETGNREQLVVSSPREGFKKGIAPQTSFAAFEVPPIAYLDLRPESQGDNAHRRPWERPKVFIGKARKSRGNWRMAAFADTVGRVAYQTLIGIWPHDPHLVVWLAAVLNGPLANAFIATLEGTRDVDIKTLKRIPVPTPSRLDVAETERLVKEYQQATKAEEFELADRLIRNIDALILDSYGLSPRLQRELLDFFNNNRRSVPFPFGNYFPTDFEPYFRLSEWLTGKPKAATAKRFRSQPRDLPKHILEALANTEEGGDE